MDDDFAFGNVWGDSSSPKAIPSSLLAPPVKAKPVPSFDDFIASEPSAFTSTLAQDDDDFGDFGDFGDVPFHSQTMDQFDDDDAFGDPVQAGLPQIAVAQGPWQSLRLNPMPDIETLQEEIDSILAPLWAHLIDPTSMSREVVRQIDEPTQLLLTPESQQLYKVLLDSPLPQVRPPNWIRSRTRRQHLIALGIPINLDEVLPQANGKPMPTLHITTRPSSAPPTPRVAPAHVSLQRESVTRSSTPKPSSRPGLGKEHTSDIGPAPLLDQAKIDEMLSLDPETMPLLPLPVLNAHLDSLRGLTAMSSNLLSYLLQKKDSLQQESERYNTLIAELISKESKKLKGGSAKAKPVKRGSGF